MIKRFIPERTPNELEQRLRLLKQNGAEFPSRWPHMSRTTWFICSGLLVAVAIGIATWLITKPTPASKQPADALTQSVLAQISGFTPYYLKPSFSTDFSLQPETIAYQDNVLEFSLKNPQGHSLAFTEEATPPGFDTSGLKADAEYSNEYGHAYISDLVDRTTGALFTHDGTWILINAPTPIGASTMRSIVDNLAPEKH